MFEEAVVKKKTRSRKSATISDENGTTKVSTSEVAPKRKVRAKTVGTDIGSQKVEKPRTTTARRKKAEKTGSGDDETVGWRGNLLDIVIENEASVKQNEASRKIEGQNKEALTDNNPSKPSPLPVPSKVESSNTAARSTLVDEFTLDNQASTLPKTTCMSANLQSTEPVGAIGTVVHEATVSSNQQIMSGNSSSAPPKATASSQASSEVKSSFLSSFLSDAAIDQPISTEADTYTDRSAFNKSSRPSVADLLAGDGVSSTSNLASPAPSSPSASSKVRSQASVPDLDNFIETKRPRASAIPITAPKTFSALKVTKFPDDRQFAKMDPRQGIRRKTLEPQSYSSGSFGAFKASPTLAALVDGQKEKSIGERAAKISQSPAGQEAATASPALPASNETATAQTHAQHQSQPSSIKEAAKAFVNETSQPTGPAMSSIPLSTSQARPQLKATPSQVPQRPAPAASKPAGLDPSFLPRKPTQMSPAELRADPHFRAMRRRWTGLIVGIPFLIATSYILWGRLGNDIKVEIDDRLGGGLGRTRGVYGSGPGDRQEGKRLLEEDASTETRR